MYIFSFSLVLIISFGINNIDCTTQDAEILTDEISSIYFDIEEFQKTLNDDNPSIENVLKIVKEIGSTLILMLSKLESSTSFESALISKVQNLNNEMEKLSKNLNETECSLSTRIIDIENDISKLKEEPKVQMEPGRALAFYRRGNVRKIFMDTDFFLTPKLSYLHAKMHCLREGGTPFVPKTMDELHYIVKQLTRLDVYGWLPLYNIKDEGVVEWDDGTSYWDGPIHVPIKEEHFTSNKGPWDCVAIEQYIVGYWQSCSFVHKMLCLKIE